MNHIVHILFSEKLNQFYTGLTSNLKESLKFHKNAENRKFTYNTSDWIVYFKINCDSKNQGLVIEKLIKSMKSKKYIQNLIKYPEMNEKLKSKFASSS